MPYWSLLLLFLIPLVPFLQPDFLAMATLSTIDEELSSVHAESIDEEETQIVPETQFENDYGDDLDLNDKENDDRPAISDRDSMTPGTKTMLDAYRPSSSKGLALAAEDFTFQLSRPKSSGEDSVTGGFIFAKHEIPKMNFQHGKRQKSPLPEAQKQQDANEYREGEVAAFFAFLMLTPGRKAASSQGANQAQPYPGGDSG